MTRPQDGWMARKAAGLAALAEGNREGRPAVRVALLASFNVDPIAPFLAEACARAGLWCEPYLGPFGQVAQEILDPGSGLHRFAPDAVVLVVMVMSCSCVVPFRAGWWTGPAVAGPRRFTRRSPGG